jgi:hypothetical protein
MKISILNTTIFFNYMVTFKEYTINKNNVSYMVKRPDGTYNVFMNMVQSLMLMRQHLML